MTGSYTNKPQGSRFSIWESKESINLPQLEQKGRNLIFYCLILIKIKH